MSTTASSTYPIWKFYPSRSPAPEWVAHVVAAFASVAPQLDSRLNQGVSSDEALAALRPALVALGFEIEASKTKADKIWRPVLFGEVGRPLVAYDVDGFHSGHGIVLEVEAGRGAASNADYRDLIRASLIVDAEYLILAMRLEYRSGTTTLRSYERTGADRRDLRERAAQAALQGRPARRLLTARRQQPAISRTARLGSTRGRASYPARMAARETLTIDLDAEVASLLCAHAAAAHVSEGEIVARAIRALDVRSLVAGIRERSDLDEEKAMALAREELHAMRAERGDAA